MIHSTTEHKGAVAGFTTGTVIDFNRTPSYSDHYKRVILLSFARWFAGEIGEGIAGGN